MTQHQCPKCGKRFDCDVDGRDCQLPYSWECSDCLRAIGLGYENVIQTIENVLPDIIEMYGEDSDEVKEYRMAQDVLAKD